MVVLESALAWAKSPRRSALLAWALLRLPIVLVVLYALREPIYSAIEARFDIVWITLLIIDIASLPLARGLIALVLGLAFFGIAKAALRLPWEIPRYIIAVAAASALGFILVLWTGSNPLWIVPPAALLAGNWAPDALFALLRIPQIVVKAAIAFVPGLSEGFATKRYVDWVLDLVGRGPLGGKTAYGLSSAAFGAALAALALAVMIEGPKFQDLERTIRSGPDVRVIAKADLNGMVLGNGGRYLFVTGHDATHLRRYDTEDIDAPPVESDIETEMAQALAYDPAANEIYLYAETARVIRVFNGESMTLQRELAVPDLSPGDPWIVYDGRTGTVVIVSERDIETATPFYVLDGETGEVVAESTEEPGNLLLSPEAPVLYGSYYRRGPGLGVYDLETRTLRERIFTADRLDRMAFDTKRHQLLATVPVNAEIRAFDPDTLEVVDSFSGPFGVRSLTIVDNGDALLAASLATGRIALISLDDRRIQKTWYVGPWLRTIVDQPDRGVAYVTSNGTLYELRYADRD